MLGFGAVQEREPNEVERRAESESFGLRSSVPGWSIVGLEGGSWVIVGAHGGRGCIVGALPVNIVHSKNRDFGLGEVVLTAT